MAANLESIGTVLNAKSENWAIIFNLGTVNPPTNSS